MKPEPQWLAQEPLECLPFSAVGGVEFRMMMGCSAGRDQSRAESQHAHKNEWQSPKIEGKLVCMRSAMFDWLTDGGDVNLLR